MPGLLAAQPPVPLQEASITAVAHGPGDLDTRLPHGRQEAEVRHHRHRHPSLELAAAIEIGRDQRDQVVAVVEPAFRVDGEDPIAVAVIGEADIGSALADQLDQALRVVDPQSRLMLRPSGSSPTASTSAPAVKTAGAAR